MKCVSDIEVGSWVRVKGDTGLYSVCELGFRKVRLLKRWPRPEEEVSRDKNELVLLFWEDLGVFEKELVNNCADPARVLRDEYFRQIFSKDEDI